MMKTAILLLLVVIPGCADLTRFDYLEVDPHPGQQLAVDMFNEYYGETLAPTNITWVDEEYGLWVDETWGMMPGNRRGGYFIERGFGDADDSCGEIYIVLRGENIEDTNLVHELTHCMLSKQYGDPEGWMPKGYKVPKGVIEVKGHKSDWWHDGDGVDELFEIYTLIKETRMSR